MKHKKMSTRILAIVLSIAMVCIVLPVNAFADGDEPTGTIENSESNPTNAIESDTPGGEALDAPLPAALNMITVGTSGADYTTITEALEHATNDSIIQLVTGIEESVSIKQDTNIMIDLNGQTWTNAPASQNVITVLSGAALTIKDSGDDGKIINMGAGASINNMGTCTIISGTIKGAKYGIQLAYTGVLTVKGGNIIIGEATSSDTYGIWNKGGKADIQGGFIEAFGTRARAIQNQVAPIVGTRSQVTMSDGHLTVTGNGAMAIQIDKGSLNITGGSIYASAADSNTAVTVIDSQGTSAGQDTTVNIADAVTISPEGQLLPQTRLYQQTVQFKASEKSGSASFNLKDQAADYDDYTGMRWFIYTQSNTTTPDSTITASSSGKILTLKGITNNNTYYAKAYDRSHGKGISGLYLYTLNVMGIGAADPDFTNNLSTDEVTYGVNATAATLDATATVNDGGTITYEWYKKTKSSDPEGTKLNVTTPTYTPSTGSIGTTYYYCVATNTIADNGDGGTKTATITSRHAQITVDKPAAEKLVEAKELAEDVIMKISLTNETDLPKVVEEAIVNIPKVTVRWKQEPVIQKATRQDTGIIIGTILLTCDGETVEVSVNREIPILPITVGSPGSGAEYTTIQEAINAASNGDTIQLITAITESIKTNGKSINFDLNGQKWTGTNDNTIIIESNSYVVILDSGKGGIIENAPNKDTAVVVSEGAGFITGGTIKGKSRGVDVKDRSSFAVSGGKVVVGQDASQDFGTVAIYNEGGQVEVQDGYVEAIGKNARAIINENSSNNQWSGAYISGGTISVTGDDSIVIVHNSGPLYMYGGNLVATPVSPDGDCLIINRTGDGTTSIHDEVTMSPEGKMMPITVLNEKSLTSPITLGVASYPLEENYNGMNWFVYTTPTGKELASNVTASSSGKTLTLKGVTSNTTYYVAAYDRANGKGISSTRWTVKTTKPTSAEVPTLTKDLSTNEVIYDLRANATALNATATASDSGQITYEWFKNTKNSTTGGTKLNVTTATYTPSTDSTGTTYYYAVVTNTVNGEGGIKTNSVTTSIAKITVANNGNGNGGSSSGNSGGTTFNPTTPSTPSTSTGTAVTVGGKTEHIGTENKTGTSTTVTVNQDKFNASIGGAVAGSSVIVPVSQNGIATAQFVVKNIQDMATKDMILTVQTGNVAYNLSTAAIDTAALAAAFPGADTTKIPFDVSIKNSSATIKGETLVLPPVEFTITATYEGRSINVDTFNAYIDRVIEITKEQASKVTTAIVANADGSVRHVPTDVYEKSGKYFATINSRTNSTYALIYNDVTFADAAGKWYAAIANEMASRKIVTGYDTEYFAGENSITRAEFSAILVRALGLPANGTSTFSDVATSAWYNGAVATAAQYGLVSGDGNNQFAPRDNITRQEAMLMLQRAAKLTKFAGTSGNLDSFKDAIHVASWARNAAEWNVGSGLIQGNNGQLTPTDNITRAESLAIILRLLQKAKLVDVRSEV